MKKKRRRKGADSHPPARARKRPTCTRTLQRQFAWLENDFQVFQNNSVSQKHVKVVFDPYELTL